MTTAPADRTAWARPHVEIRGGWTLWIPGLKLVSEANAHEHWRERQRRAKEQHLLVGAMLGLARKPQLPLRVVITRVSPQALDTDNATGSGKHVRDAVARWLGIDDRSTAVEWIVVQEKGAIGTRVEIVPVPALDGAAVGARVTPGAVLQVEMILAPEHLAQLGKAITARAAGDGPDVIATIGTTRFAFRRSTEVPR